jgi:hypothetical protein
MSLPERSPQPGLCWCGMVPLGQVMKIFKERMGYLCFWDFRPLDRAPGRSWNLIRCAQMLVTSACAKWLWAMHRR